MLCHSTAQTLKLAKHFFKHILNRCVYFLNSCLYCLETKHQCLKSKHKTLEWKHMFIIMVRTVYAECSARMMFRVHMQQIQTDAQNLNFYLDLCLGIYKWCLYFSQSSLHKRACMIAHNWTMDKKSSDVMVDLLQGTLHNGSVSNIMFFPNQ